MPIPFYHPKPAPPAAFGGQLLPQKKANPFSRAVFSWISPIMRVGYSRPLEAEDLWTLTDDLLCETNADVLEAHFQRLLPPSMRMHKFRPANYASINEKTGADSEASTKAASHSVIDEGQMDDSAKLREKEAADTATEEEGVAEAVDIFAPAVAAAGFKADAGDTNITHPLPSAQIDDQVQPDGKNVMSKGKKIEKPPLDPVLVKKHGKRKARKLAQGKYVVEEDQVYTMSLLGAIYSSVWFAWWKSIILSAAGSTLQVTAPLVTRQIISQMELAYAVHQTEKAGGSTAGLPMPRSVGYGVGLAVALFVMQIAASLFNYQSQQRGATIGFSMRAALIDLISRKSMRLSGRSRIDYPNGRMVTMVSADASFLDFAAPMTINLVVEPLQIIVGIALLIYTLGYSALVGLAILLAAAPFQGFMFNRMIMYRQAQMKVVDTRVRLLSEIINNIRAVKLYAYEVIFGERVSVLRRKEMAKLRKNGLNRATMSATSAFIPVLSAVLTFITYGLSGHPLNASTIFSGLQYFNVLRTPISFLPMALTAVSDAAVAIGRIGDLLRAEELPHDIVINPSAKLAISVDGDFQFDSVNPPDSGSSGGGGPGRRGGRDRASKREDAKQKKRDKIEARDRKKKGLTPLIKEEIKEEGIPFSLRDVHLKIPRGSLVCIVGRVGTGKTALLSAMLNDMRKLDSTVVFGGPVSYVPQQAWVQSGSIRENITFGASEDEVDQERVDEVIDACALRHEMDMWPDGDQTKIGEKGITLSGGQRQRICLARAAYDYKSEIVILDDPLSAVDAHVGHHLLRHCILSGPLAERTRVLVTHHLDVLPSADLVLVLDRGDNNVGRVIQQGTYAALREQEGVFKTLMEDFGSTTQSKTEEEEVEEDVKAVRDKKGPAGKFMLDEEREIGSVSWRVYTKFGAAAGGWTWLGCCALFLSLTQASQVGNTLFLGFWSSMSIPGFRSGDYMGLYAGFGVAAMVFTWLATYNMYLSGIRASYRLFNGAWLHVMRSTTGWHDRTPTGRVINRLSKDIQMLDDRLALIWNQLLQNALSVVGTFALVIYAFPYLGLMFIPLGILYYICASYYRTTSREVKRVDSILRSFVYSSFGEQLAGLPVIRAFEQQENFVRRLQHSVNIECQAYIVTITIQRWLGIRLDLMSYSLVMLISIFGAVFRETVSPSKLGVVLTYSLQAASVFSNLVQLFAQVEQEMNNVERVQFYNDLPMEADPHLPTDPPVSEWPSQGLVEFKEVELKYRPDLPLILKDLSFTFKPGEKVGIIGRTGAGKSSIAQALFRTVELSGGQIVVDGKNLREIGLDTLRQRIAIIPQDAFLFAGSVRDNIDPAGTQSDADLNDTINLVHTNSGNSDSFREKFRLDATVLNEGGNFSAGERQLLALIRALARKCKVLLLDEATSSVDPETDAVIQRIIQTELTDVTLISIAHRLQTVAYYDRILVMDDGQVAEFDSPLALYDDPSSHFRRLCNTKQLNRDDLVKIQREAMEANEAGRRQ